MLINFFGAVRIRHSLRARYGKIEEKTLSHGELLWRGIFVKISRGTTESVGGRICAPRYPAYNRGRIPMEKDVIITREGERIRALLPSDIDHHRAKLIREKIDAELSGAYRRLVLDFSGVTFMDSSGIGLIMGRYRLARSLGSTLRVRGASPRMETVIRLAGMDNLPLWDNERTDTDETKQ